VMPYPPSMKTPPHFDMLLIFQPTGSFQKLSYATIFHCFTPFICKSLLYATFLKLVLLVFKINSVGFASRTCTYELLIVKEPLSPFSANYHLPSGLLSSSRIASLEESPEIVKEFIMISELKNNRFLIVSSIS